MFLSEEGAAILLAFLAVFVVLLLAIAGFGLWLASRGWRITGLGIAAAVLAFAFGPYLIDQARMVPLRADLVERSMIPEALDLRDQRVLFITSGSFHCGVICEDALRLGTEFEAYVLPAAGPAYGDTSTTPLQDLLNRSGDVHRVQLGAPVPALDGFSYAEIQAERGTPPFDVVIFADLAGVLTDVAPHLLGAPLPESITVTSTTLVFTDWPDPFSTPAPEPTYRSVSGRIEWRPIVIWPVSQSDGLFPAADRGQPLWQRALCPFANEDPGARDAFTYAYLCAPETLDEVLN